ncbi:GNAT family N-acetyltransferase [Pseudodesulfovibrio piezophilus]|uniref:GCN5-related N-acetyltransferase n=1 Tax=Pseudodesulfovibrio piezophilus (strain DSM 21447 / JCM 15486 / C1TLV30) TaxID=1322246 RepID=M1WYA1_PSEP2|nr:GNAT family N-acetyltransferase [Pseudodesulfovibrio piezophilus]CCH50228.1 GCN5-related N-acetyltransferase [Pseudodesulfovibrio piezophilus C1TLV30]
MDMIINEEIRPCDVREIHIISGVAPADVENILNMAAASGLFSSDAMMSAEDMAWDSAYGDGSETHTFLQATVNESGTEKTVGFICYGRIPHWTETYELYGIAVDPEFQRLGIGSALISEMKRQVTAGTGKRIFLETGASRAYENARLFYEANEFQLENRFHKHFVPSDGGIVYRLILESQESDLQYQ